MADKQDYYETLGVPRSASDDEIKRAWRGLAKKYHPDVNPGDKQAEEKLKKINEAYGALSDKQKRQAYDQFGHAAFDGSAGAGGFSADFGMGDIFETIFGDGSFDIFGGGRSRQGQNQGPRRGADLHTNLQIKFEEAIFGVEKEITINVQEICKECKGGGAKPGTFAETCKQCGGVGQERVVQQTMFGALTSARVCSKCLGSGKIIKDPCPVCSGSGRVRQRKTLKVTIPKGIDSEQMIRLAGKGELGQKGGPQGDLHITVHVTPHKYFKRQGNNLYVTVPVSFAQAALGDEIVIPLLNGAADHYAIKPGSQTGTTAVLKGRGVPHIRNNKIFGDLIVTFVVSVPTQMTEKQKQALRVFAEEMGEDSKEMKRGFFDKFKESFKQ
jgi:molecular chaperone DnaJ